MNFRKVTALTLSAVTAASLLAGCGSGSKSSGTEGKSGSSKGATTITVWGPQEDQSKENGEWLQTECKAFAKAHPEWNIKFKYGTCSEGDAGKNVTKDPSAAADVYMFANDQLGTLLDANAISELGGDTLNQVKSDNSEAMVNTVTFNGSVYGVPFTGNTWFLYYDKSKFSDDDVKSLDTMMQKGTVACQIANGWYLGSFFAANGGTFFGKDGQDEKAGIQLGDGASKVTDYLIDAVASGKLVNDNNGSALSNFGKGVDAFFSGSWDYTKAADAIGKDKLGVATLPTITIDGEAKQMKSFAGSKAIAVNPNCKNPKIAVALAAFLGSKDAQEAHYKTRNIIPTVSSVDVGDDVLAKVQAETIDKNSVLQSSFSEMGKWWDPAAALGNGILDGSITKSNSAEQTATLQDQVNSSAVK
jgi:arabinogalactan oligomer/maltooligosaccharide transport system substrate-binding protein